MKLYTLCKWTLLAALGFSVCCTAATLEELANSFVTGLSWLGFIFVLLFVTAITLPDRRDKDGK